MTASRPGLEGKVAIVTGGARGIGRAICQALAEDGVSIVVADRDLSAAQTLERTLRDRDARALAVEVDVSRRADVARMMKAALDRFGQIHILVNNAGITSIYPFTDIPEEDWDRVLAVNAKGTFLCCQLVAPHMIAARSGRIVNIASQAGISGQAFMAHYVASKFAVVGLTQSLALELGPYGITVNAVCPGDVTTDMRALVSQSLSVLKGITQEELTAQAIRRCPLGRLETPEDVAQAVLFLVSDSAAFITGEALNVSGGLEFH
jgi:meso-butanediol dehydrogenase/(S,S)-butanediol dehydrogenase/diacetyl reductase